MNVDKIVMLRKVVCLLFLSYTVDLISGESLNMIISPQ